MLRCLFCLVVLQASTGVGQDSAEDCWQRFYKELESNPKSSLVHFRTGECLWRVKDRAAAVNEFRVALNGDQKPSWVKVWAHLNVGRIFDATGQRDRALNEYRLGEETGDNTFGAQNEIAKCKQSACTTEP